MNQPSIEVIVRFQSEDDTELMLPAVPIPGDRIHYEGNLYVVSKRVFGIDPCSGECRVVVNVHEA